MQAVLRPYKLKICVFCHRSHFRGNRANESRLQAKFSKIIPISRKGDRRLVEFHVNNVVIAVDFVAQAWHGFELMIELQNFIQGRERQRHKPRVRSSFSSLGDYDEQADLKQIRKSTAHHAIACLIAR